MTTRTRWLSRAIATLFVVAPVARAQQPGGELVADTVQSKALATNVYGDSPNRAVLVYLPPSYRSSPQRRYPVVYLLHGFGGTERTWATAFPIKARADSAIASGASKEMIVVMPNARTVFDGSFYTNSASNGNWETFVSDELVAFIDRKYRTLAKPESRGLAGHSMGGFGTLSIGMHKAGDVFGALYAMSACCTSSDPSGGQAATWDSIAVLTSLSDARRLGFFPKVSLALAAALSPNPSKGPLFVDLPRERIGAESRPVEAVIRRWREGSPLARVGESAERLKRLRGFTFDVGTSDPLVPLRQLAALDTALMRAGVPHAFETYEGNHTNAISERLGSRVLPFFSRTLDFGSR